MKMPSLLPDAAFDSVFTPMIGKRIGYLRMIGNVGDALIERATFEAMAEREIDVVLEDPRRNPVLHEWAVAGGGNMGNRYMACQRARKRVLRDGRPVTVLPQSFSSPEPLPYHRVFVRERGSLKYCPEAILAPDLTLGMKVEAPGAPDLGTGLWLRQDAEGIFRDVPCRGDPVAVCPTPTEYLALAGRHEHVITDRLHFAIAALLMRRRATLLPNGYHKNFSMYETWLRDLGCDWKDTP